MAYATLDEVKSRLDWTLDADEERIAISALDDASALAAHYGREWTTAPQLAKTLVLKAVVRYMRNPDGYTQSRAGDETLAWNDSAGENAGTVYFTDEEQKLLGELGGKSRVLGSIQVVAWQSKIRPDAGYVPVAGSNEPFPLFADPVEPW